MPRLTHFFLALFFVMFHNCFAASYCVITGIDSQGFQKRCAEDIFRSSVGASLATYGDAFKINPSSLPIQKTGLGFEVLASSRGESTALGADFQISLIKGFRDFGFGVSADPSNTFYSSKIADTSIPSSSVPELSLDLGSLNFGTAFLLNDAAKSFLKSPLIAGAALILDPQNKNKGYSAGMNLGSKTLGGGISYVRDPNDQIPTWNFSLSMAAGSFDLDFIYKKIGAEFLTSNTTETQWIGNLSYRISKFTFIAALKRHRSDLEGFGLPVTSSTRALISAILTFGPRLRAAYLFNYRQNSHSLGIQALLF